MTRCATPSCPPSSPSACSRPLVGLVTANGEHGLSLHGPPDRDRRRRRPGVRRPPADPVLARPHRAREATAGQPRVRRTADPGRQLRHAGAAGRGARAAVQRIALLHRPRHPGADLHHAGLGPEHRRRPRRPARPRLRRVLRRRRLFLRAAGARPSAWASGPACRWPASWRRSGASCSASRCCACAATTSPSSPWRSARSSASC